jgi:O-antigen ligase
MWNDILLSVLFVICLAWFLQDRVLRERLKSSYLALAVVVFAVFQLLFALRGIAIGTVGFEAAAVGLTLNVRGPLFLLCCIVLMKYSSWPQGRWLRIMVGSAVIVAAFAVLQFTVLPKNFLTHFGYGPNTILPYETINSNESYVRFASTTRGVNPLGAYMAIMIPLVIALWAKLRPKLTWLLIVALMFGAMIVSFSRSAWIGCAVALVCLLALRLKTRRDWLWASGIAAVILILVGITFAAVPKSTVFQNIFLHTDDKSTIREDSNDARYGAFFTTMREIVHEPLGRGVGSAGPASVHNTKAEPRIAENYFLQITQETGWFGLFVYLAMLVIIGLQLWRLRGRRLALGLFAALLGTVVINMLSFAWTDDTLAFTWFGLAGLVLGGWMWRQSKPHDSIDE